MPPTTCQSISAMVAAKPQQLITRSKLGQVYRRLCIRATTSHMDLIRIRHRSRQMTPGFGPQSPGTTTKALALLANITFSIRRQCPPCVRQLPRCRLRASHGSLSTPPGLLPCDLQHQGLLLSQTSTRFLSLILADLTLLLLMRPKCQFRSPSMTGHQCVGLGGLKAGTRFVI